MIDKIRYTLFRAGFTYEQNSMSCVETQAIFWQKNELINW